MADVIDNNEDLVYSRPLAYHEVLQWALHGRAKYGLEQKMCRLISYSLSKYALLVAIACVVVLFNTGD